MYRPLSLSSVHAHALCPTDIHTSFIARHTDPLCCLPVETCMEYENSSRAECEKIQQDCLKDIIAFGSNCFRTRSASSVSFVLIRSHYSLIGSWCEQILYRFSILFSPPLLFFNAFLLSLPLLLHLILILPSPESVSLKQSVSHQYATSAFYFLFFSTTIPRLCCVFVLVQGAGDTDIHMVRLVSDPQWRGLRGPGLEGEPELTLRRGEPQPDRHPRERSRMVRVQGRLPQQVAQQERHLVPSGRPR